MSALSKERLKPCPFCGSNPEVINYNRYDLAYVYSVYCKHCGVETTEFPECEEAIAAWNRRKEKP